MSTQKRNSRLALEEIYRSIRQSDNDGDEIDVLLELKSNIRAIVEDVLGGSIEKIRPWNDNLDYLYDPEDDD